MICAGVSWLARLAIALLFAAPRAWPAAVGVLAVAAVPAISGCAVCKAGATRCAAGDEAQACFGGSWRTVSRCADVARRSGGAWACRGEPAACRRVP